jgi:hypothetical protein
LKRIVMALMVAALVAVAMMGSSGAAFGAPKFTDLLVGGCAGNNNATSKQESQGVSKASPDLFANCGEALPPGQEEPTMPTP